MLLINLKKRFPFSGQCVVMCDVNIMQSDTLAVLCISIRSDLCWDDHIFVIAKEADKCLGFLKQINYSHRVY